MKPPKPEDADISNLSYNIRVKTPDGTMFVTVVEKLNEKIPTPIQVLIHIGKAGTGIAAWGSITESLVTLLFQKGVTIEEIMSMLSLNTSQNIAFQKVGVNIRSGPEGLVYALMRYQQERNRRLDSL